MQLAPAAKPGSKKTVMIVLAVVVVLLLGVGGYFLFAGSDDASDRYTALPACTAIGDKTPELPPVKVNRCATFVRASML